MSHFLIEGGRPLNGTVVPSGNKNEVLPALMACLLTEDDVTLTRVPRIKDVLTVCDVLSGLGVKVTWETESTLTLNARHLKSHKPDSNLCAKVRASILFLGPLLARLGKVELAPPGGDVIGARRIDVHFEGMQALGAELGYGPPITGKLSKLVGGDVFLDEPSVTATENLLLLAARSDATTRVHNAACEPHVVGLSRMLTSMGAVIEGIGSNTLTIKGVSQLRGCVHQIGVDFMEVGSFLCLGAITEGTIRIDDINLDDLRFILKKYKRLGINPSYQNGSLSIDQSSLTMEYDLGGRIGSIWSGPWPAFPSDLMSVTIVSATQAKGTMIFHEKMFEGRMFFTDILMSMGANIVLCDPHRIVITGPSPLKGTRMSSPDVRAGMAMVLAALVAEGTSSIHNIYQIERGYFEVERKLEALGAAITRKN